jgi:phosphatidylserine/phosphatidylglycerophosphate/cardiolipin synthase-like enzyme
MRFKSKTVDGFQAFGVSGTNTVSFALTATDAARNGLLGFAVERSEPAANKRFTMSGFKVFRSIIPNPDENTRVSTADHPIQSFVWDDFTAKPDTIYEYSFRPLRGTPAALDRTADAVPIRIRTEKLFSDDEHGVYFNRGVASSQAYKHKFGNQKPDQMAPAKQKEALDWLTRDLDDAILGFIANAGANDSLHCSFYEFRYAPVLDALEAARKKGVDLTIIIDAKVNEFTDKKGVFHESFPREENLRAIKKAGLPASVIIRRDRNPADIQHNKFMVLLKGAAKKPAEVWSGSTNISLGGLSGQTNVGHWVKDATTAKAYEAYWQLLATNPGSKKGDSQSEAKKKKKAYRDAVEALATVPTKVADIPQGVRTVFSPRAGSEVLALYVDLVDSAKSSAAVTLAFGINKLFKDQLKDNTDQSGIVFMLLESKDKPDKNKKTAFVAINASNNVYKAWGAFIKDPVYQWAKETNAKALGLNTHVSYIHSKFLLRDPLSKDPIVITGSANFSAASTNDNDENMLLIRGSLKAADIYFTEFNRLFNHYYFRSVMEDRGDHGKKPDDASLFLSETADKWLKKYKPGTLRTKRVAAYAAMEGVTTL